jgi:hypothetical protein
VKGVSISLRGVIIRWVLGEVECVKYGRSTVDCMPPGFDVRLFGAVTIMILPSGNSSMLEDKKDDSLSRRKPYC